MGHGALARAAVAVGGARVVVGRRPRAEVAAPRGLEDDPALRNGHVATARRGGPAAFGGRPVGEPAPVVAPVFDDVVGAVRAEPIHGGPVCPEGLPHRVGDLAVGAHVPRLRGAVRARRVPVAHLLRAGRSARGKIAVEARDEAPRARGAALARGAREVERPIGLAPRAREPEVAHFERGGGGQLHHAQRGREVGGHMEHEGHARPARRAAEARDAQRGARHRRRKP